MKLFTNLIVRFYTLIILIVGLILILMPISLSLQIIRPEYIAVLLNFVETQQLLMGIIGLFLVLSSFGFSQLILGKIQREKTIAFTNPQGEVIVSLSAVEDLIRRIISVIPEIKDSRPSVIAGKKGIEIDLRLILRSEVNIPEFTSRIQELIRTKIQDILGVEETIMIRVYVVKISMEEQKKKKEPQNQEEEPLIPFHGYGKNL